MTPVPTPRLALTLVLLATLAAPLDAQRRTRRAESERETITYGGLTRTYLLRVPDRVARGSARVPLVIMLHGGGGNGANAERMTGFTAKAEAEGFIVAYPDGTARRGPLLTWNAEHCCGDAMRRDVDDAGFLGALIDTLVARGRVDARRVYLTGMSNGGMMAHRAAIALGGKIAAIAPVVGAVFGDEPAARAPVSMLAINGLEDRSVPWSGGQSAARTAGAWDGTPSAPALEQGKYWARAARCDATPATRDERAVERTSWRCPSGVDVQVVGVKGVGHAWPGGRRGTPRADDPGDAFDATDAIWRFFAAHPRR